MRQVVLLRGINVGPHNRIAMPALREALSDFEDVETYLQSGNVVLSSSLGSPKLIEAVKARIRDVFGLDIDVLVRTAAEIAAIVELDPLGEVAVEPKRYQVSFLSQPLAGDVLESLTGLASDAERFVAIGHEVYAWHPDGIGRSKLWAKLARPAPGVVATARNWTTVTRLAELAQSGE